MANLCITLVIGLIGGLTALRFKVPAGAMIGAMLSVALFNVITGSAFLPQDVKIVTQMAAGAFIGAGIKYKDVLSLKSMVKPAVLMVLSMIILDLFMGYAMYRMTEIDLVTSLFACAPGGVVDMSLISNDMGADSSKVAILQTVRLMSVMILFPAMMKFISNYIANRKEIDESKETAMDGSETFTPAKADRTKYTVKEKSINLSLTMFIAFTAGLIGYILKVPAGAMTFSMIAVGALNIFWSRGYMPINIRRLTQVLAGILIGERMTFESLIALKDVIIPAFILLIGIIIVNLCIGLFISRTSGLELITSLFASTPGGVADMAIIAEDLGADAPKVAVLQLARYVCVIAIFPIIIKYICK